jgi:enoyl reductase
MSLRAVGTVGVGLIGIRVPPAPAAFATGSDRFGRDKDVTGGRDDQTVYAGASYKGVVFDPPAGETAGSLSPGSGSAWTPPPCYYAPRWKASEFKDFWDNHAEHMARKTEDAATAAEIIRKHEERYGPDSEYADHNIAKEDEGSWWTAYANPDSPDKSGHTSCNEPTFWVDYGDPPPALPGAPDARLLAELAYAQVDIPALEVELNPQAQAQKVNLDTWVWLPASELAPVSVTASLDGYAALSSTVTATPSRLTLDPGTADALVHTGPDGCTISPDGSIGEPWAAAKKGLTPPCGVTYLRATSDRSSYPLSATLTWSIAWEGSDGSGDSLPDGEFTTTQELTVEEIQTIVR